jgi:thiol-disulfide isomerase/thioredoxin
MAAYPAPLEVTQPALSSTPDPTVTPSENLLAVPYPLLETPLPQQINGSNPSPYPPPVEVPTQVSHTSAAANPIPTGIGSATPISQNTASPSITPILTPQATRVKTRFVATDPRTVDLEAGRPQMVVFFTKWCMLCKSVAPVLLSLESQYSDRVNFIYLDADEAETKALQKKFSYRLIARPRIFLIDGTGVILRDWTGYVAIEELQQALDSVVPAAVAPATIAPVSP